jgi:16S rRNA G1207 methylase RsmC
VKARVKSFRLRQGFQLTKGSLSAMGEATVEELKQAAEESLKALARALGAKTYIFVVAGNNEVVRSSSHDLKPYERALVDEIEKASAK